MWKYILRYKTAVKYKKTWKYSHSSLCYLCASGVLQYNMFVWGSVRRFKSLFTENHPFWCKPQNLRTASKNHSVIDVKLGVTSWHGNICEWDLRYGRSRMDYFYSAFFYFWTTYTFNCERDQLRYSDWHLLCYIRRNKWWHNFPFWVS